MYRNDDPPNHDTPLVTRLSERICHARKLHRCAICGDFIAVGKQYIRYTYIDDEALTRNTRFKCTRIHWMCDSEVAP